MYGCSTSLPHHPTQYRTIASTCMQLSLCIICELELARWASFPWQQRKGNYGINKLNPTIPGCQSHRCMSPSYGQWSSWPAVYFSAAKEDKHTSIVNLFKFLLMTDQFALRESKRGLALALGSLIDSVCALVYNN